MRARKLRPGMRLRWTTAWVTLDEEVLTVANGWVTLSWGTDEPIRWRIWPLLECFRAGYVVVLK